MLEHPAMSMQSIAKWFEEGCSQTDNTGAGTGTGIGNNNNKNSTSNLSTSSQSSEESTNTATATDTTTTTTNNNNSFPILECTDIYLLSQLLGVKSETLLERATRQLAAIEELPLRKDRLLAISGELTLLSPESGGGGGHHHRRPVALRLLTEQIDGRSPLFARFPDQLYFHRALVRLKDRQLTEALTDLYLGLNLHVNMDNSFSSGGLKHTADVEQQRSLDPIHVLILKEIKKYLTSSSESDCSTQIILVPDIGPVSFDQVLKQYDQYVSQFIRRQLFSAADDDDDYSLTQSERTEAQGDELELFKKWWPTIEQENQSDILPEQPQQQKFLSTLSEKPPSPPSLSCSTPKPTYKSMLMGENKQAHLETEEAKDENEDTDDDDEEKEEEQKADQNSNQNKSHNSSTNNSSASLQSNTTEGKEQKWKELNKPPEISEVSYTVEVPHHNNHHHSLKKTITVQLAWMKRGGKEGKGDDIKANHGPPPLLDNLFNMRALLVGNLAPGAQLSSISQLFAAFGTVLNVQFVKAVSSSSNAQKVIRLAALVEFDNAHSPRLAISALSEVSLPYISEQWHLTFRFARGDGQRRMRICKENQVRSSRECYFWRTTGCRFAEGGRSGGGGGGGGHCKFYHHRLAKGVDYQDWMIGCVSSEATATSDGD